MRGVKQCDGEMNCDQRRRDERKSGGESIGRPTRTSHKTARPIKTRGIIRMAIRRMITIGRLHTYTSCNCQLKIFIAAPD